MKSSFLKNTIPISYIQHCFHEVYALYNKKKQLLEVCFKFEILRFLHHRVILCRIRHISREDKICQTSIIPILNSDTRYYLAQSRNSYIDFSYDATNNFFHLYKCFCTNIDKNKTIQYPSERCMNDFSASVRARERVCFRSNRSECAESDVSRLRCRSPIYCWLPSLDAFFCIFYL